MTNKSEVFVRGEGPAGADVMFIGEQPGHEEDLAGRPFVGPAGRELDKALATVGIDRRAVFVTNVVKNFHWEPKGKKRIHQKPGAREIAAARPWLDSEIKTVQPKAIVLLGATAAQALLGKTFRVTQQRGEKIDSPLAPIVMATIHPSSILRQRDDELRHQERERFTEDLRKLAGYLAELKQLSRRAQ
jgi:uracil-DNA glycosylase